MSVEIKEPPARTPGALIETELQSTRNVQPTWTIPAREAIEVFCSDHGNVVIRQPTYPGEGDVVVVHPSDVPRLIQMLRLARQALKGAGHG